MLSYFKSIFLLSILFIMVGCQSDTNSSSSTANKKPAPKDPSQLLEGRWENVASDKEFIIFNQGKMIRRFAGATVKDDIITNISFNFYEKCHAPCQTQSSDVDVSKFQCFTVKEDGIFTCFKITKLNAGELEFTKTDGTGPMYAYKRLQ